MFTVQVPQYIDSFLQWVQSVNETTIIPPHLRTLEIEGCIVTIDAAGRQKKIAAQICSQGGGYLLALKGNQGSLHDFVEDYFDAVPHDYFRITDAGHG